jgi:4-hydroxybenzoate polyprenyltransferase
MSDADAPAPEDQAATPAQGGIALAYLQLVRIPTVFTAVADIFLGYLLTHQSLDPVPTFMMLLVVSVCHYWTGMILNDYFDRDVDARERPGRPIPSGRIPASKALRLALVLNGLGLAVAAAVGTKTLIVAAALTAAVWLYDGALKKTMLAPVLMGSCRFLNVMLGASVSPGDFWCPHVYVPIGLGIYIMGVTWFARQEANTSSRWQLMGASMVITFGLAELLTFVMFSEPQLQRETALFVLAVIGITIIRRLTRAIAGPSPEHVQTAIKLMLLSLLMIDATLILYVTGNANYAIAVASMLLPALLLARRIPMT